MFNMTPYNFEKFTHVVRKRGLLRGIEPGAVYQFQTSAYLTIDAVRGAIESRMLSHLGEEYSWDTSDPQMIGVRRDK